MDVDTKFQNPIIAGIFREYYNIILRYIHILFVVVCCSA